MSSTQQIPGSPKRGGISPAVQQADQETWEGGGREPMHPDDVEDDGEPLGNGRQAKQLRSDDN